MVKETPANREVASAGGRRSSGDEADQRIAFLIEEGDVKDPVLLDLLLERYGRDVLWLAALTAHPDAESPLSERELLERCARAFAKAISQTAGFWGYENPQDWLFSHVIQTRGTAQSVELIGRMLDRLLSRTTEPAPDSTAATSGWIIRAHPNWPRFRRLRGDQRAVVALHFAFGLPIAKIGQILRKRTPEVRRLLLSAVLDMLQAKGAPGALAPDPAVHEDFRRKIAVDRLTETSQELAAALLRHLQGCEACSAFAQDLDSMIVNLRSRLSEQRLKLSIPAESISLLRAQAKEEIARERRIRPRIARLRKIGAAALAVILLGAAYWLGAGWIQADERGLPPPGIAPRPTRISAQPAKVIVLEEPAERRFVENPIFHSQPRLSEDGAVIVFSSTDPFLSPSAQERVTRIFTLEPERGRIQQVSVSSRGEPANAWSSSPEISANGGRVVFTSIADNLTSVVLPTCPKGDFKGPCSNIYLHDLPSNATHLVSVAHDGRAANGPSYLPGISGDGRLVTFWSEATNLVAEEPPSCPDLSPGSRCADLFLHDLGTGITTRVPIGRDVSGETITERATPSEDGGRLSITINRSDTVAQDLGFEGPTEVFVFSVVTGDFEAVDFSAEGVPGVRSSLRGAISASGEQIAFASNVAYAVRDETGGEMDVFLRDLSDGSITQVSARDHEAGPEAQAGGQAGGVPQIDVSRNGRFVLFSSSVSDLAEGSTGCGSTSITRCNGVYLRDVAQGKTTLLAPASPQVSFFGDLALSGDGRMAVVQEYLFACAPEEACSALWLIDTQSGRRIGLVGGIRPPMDTRGLREPFLSVEAGSSIRALAFSPDGGAIASGSGDGVVRIWDLPLGELSRLLRGHTLPITGVAYASDGRSLYSASRDRSLRAWRAADGALTFMTREPFGDLSGLDSSSQGDVLAAGNYRRAWIWRISANGRPSLLETIDLQEGAVTAVSLSADGTLAAIGTSDGTVEIHGVADGRLLLHLGDHSEKILALRFSQDGEYLAYGSADGTLNLWRLDGNTEDGIQAEFLLSVQLPGWINALAFLPGRSMLAFANLSNEVYLRRIPDGEAVAELRTLEGNVVSSLAVSPDGALLATGTVGGQVYFWEIGSLVSRPPESDGMSTPSALQLETIRISWTRY